MYRAVTSVARAGITVGTRMVCCVASMLLSSKRQARGSIARQCVKTANPTQSRRDIHFCTCAVQARVTLKTAKLGVLHSHLLGLLGRKMLNTPGAAPSKE
eukprot:4728266-Pyramimonas_sp.AAC.1